MQTFELQKFLFWGFPLNKNPKIFKNYYHKLINYFQFYGNCEDEDFKNQTFEESGLNFLAIISLKLNC